MIDPGNLMHLTPGAADGGLRTASEARSGAGRGANARGTDDGTFTSALSGALARAGQRGDTEGEGDLLVADGEAADAAADTADADALLDGLLGEAADSPAVGVGATIAALLRARADLAGGGEGGDGALTGELLDAVAADLVDAVLAEGGQVEGALVDGALVEGAPVEGALVDAELLDGVLVDGVLVDPELVDGTVVDGVLVDGTVADGVLVDGELVDAVVVDGELVNGELVDAVVVEPVDGAPVDVAPVDGEPTDGATADGDAPAGDVPVAAPVDGEDETSEDAGSDTDSADGDEVLTAPTDGTAAQRPGRGDAAERGAQRVDGPAAEGNRHGRSAEVRQDAFAPGQERSARPDATRATTQADANRIPVGMQAPAADAAAEVAQNAVRAAAARQVTLPPALQRIVDAASQLEHTPPPRQLTLDLGEVRVRVSLDDGGLRLTQLSGDQDAGDDILREAAELLQERGFDLAGDGEDSDGRDDDTGSERTTPLDTDRGRHARRGGLRL